MIFSAYYRHFLFNKEKYLPYLYPIIMPLLSLHATSVPARNAQDAFTYWLFTGGLQLMLLIMLEKIIYSDIYNQFIRWLIALLFGGTGLFIYLFLEYNVFHFTERLVYSHKWFPIPRYTLNIPILIALLESMKSIINRKKILINNVKLENENAKAQFNLLLQQINPHFLFNCLTVLQSMVRTKDTRTTAFIMKLEEVYRQSLKTDKGIITLREELDFFNAYMYLMRLRHENAIFVTVEVADEALLYQLPSFSLQLLAENCIKHNIASVSRPLHIRLYQKNAKTLTISNNLQPKTQRIESFGIGIKNLKKRYILEDIRQGVIIEKDETNYTTTLKLF